MADLKPKPRGEVCGKTSQHFQNGSTFAGCFYFFLPSFTERRRRGGTVSKGMYFWLNAATSVLQNVIVFRAWTIQTNTSKRREVPLCSESRYIFYSSYHISKKRRLPVCSHHPHQHLHYECIFIGSLSEVFRQRGRRLFLKSFIYKRWLFNTTSRREVSHCCPIMSVCVLCVCVFVYMLCFIHHTVQI